MPSQSAHAMQRDGDGDADATSAAGAATECGRCRTARELDDEGAADDHAVSQQVRPAFERQVPCDDARDPERPHQADPEVHRQHETACEQQRGAPRRLVDGAGHAASDDATESEAAGHDVRRIVCGVADQAEHPRREQCRGKQPQKGPERDPAGEQASSTQAVELHRLERGAEHRVRVAPLPHARHDLGAAVPLLLQAQSRLSDSGHQNASSFPTSRAPRSATPTYWTRSATASATRATRPIDLAEAADNLAPPYRGGAPLARRAASIDYGAEASDVCITVPP